MRHWFRACSLGLLEACLLLTPVVIPKANILPNQPQIHSPASRNSAYIRVIEQIKTKGEKITIQQGDEAITAYIVKGFNQELNSDVIFTYYEKSQGVLETKIADSPLIEKDSIEEEKGIKTYKVHMLCILDGDAGILDGKEDKVQVEHIFLLQSIPQKTTLAVAMNREPLESYLKDASAREKIAKAYQTALDKTIIYRRK